MYKLQEKPDPEVQLRDTVGGGPVFKPVATLKDEYGGVSHIVVDDHCYVLINGSLTWPFHYATHWYREAVEALRRLPPL